ncbi:hypothetical protein KI387_008938, partial [Taxus chinensis]
CQNQFGYGDFQEQGYANNQDNQMQDVGLLEKIQKMEIGMVQSRAIAQMKAFRIGCRTPCPWEGPFPRHYNPQEKLNFIIEMLPQLPQRTEEIEAYEQ